LFEAEIKNGKAEGMFYSGTHWKEPWMGIKNEKFELRKADEITVLKNKSGPIDFSFPSLNGRAVSLSDKIYQGRPVIIQIMGSWCPNCMDESRYLAEVYKKYHPMGLEIIALAFEKSDDWEKVKQQVQRMKNKLGVEYEILITLKTGKAKAAEIFPMLNEIIAFPTTIFLSRNHQVVNIHTGFSGPATGQNYEAYKQKTESLIEQLLKE
jgi:thiol-disulfide isomerase/thioredoxin